MSGETALAGHEPTQTATTAETRSRRRSVSTRGQRVALAVVLGVAVALGLSLDAAPTGAEGVDAIYRIGLLATCIAAGARARRRTLLMAAGLVALGSDSWMLVPAAGALAVSFTLAWTDRRDRVVGGVAGGLIGWAALELAWPASPSGATTLLAAIALLPMWFSAYRVARRSTRRWIRRALLALAAVTFLGVLVGAVLALTQRSTLTQAADTTAEAASALVSGAADGSSGAFRSSEQQFRSVSAATGSWWATPTELVPIVAQNVRAVDVAAQSGAELTAAAARLAESVDYDALSTPDGSIDLARLRGFRAPATAAAEAVAAAEDAMASVDSPWLVPPIARQRDEFSSEISRAASATDVGALAAEELPALLGADGPRRYLLLLGSPAEARDIGGHLGNWAELVADDGKLTLARVGEPYELFGPGTDPRPQLSSDLEIPASLAEMDPTRFPQNWGSSPDLATVARLAADLYPQAAGGSAIDGVLYADPAAFAALLEVTGPIEAAGRALDAQNAVQFLTVDQYLEPSAQVSSVTPLIRAALERFTGSTLPGPRQLADVFGSAIQRGHLQFVTIDDTGTSLLASVGLDQPISPPRGGDLLAVINRNANPSKIDSFLHRSIDYRVNWEPDTGAVTSRVVATLRNDAPASGLPPVVNGAATATPPGTNRTEVSVLSPFAAVGMMIDGDDVPFGSRDDVNGLRRYTVTVDLPPGAERTVILDLVGKVEAGPEYRLRWYNQPLANEDDSQVVARLDGAAFSDGNDTGRIELGTRRIEDLTIRSGER